MGLSWKTRLAMTGLVLYNEANDGGGNTMLAYHHLTAALAAVSSYSHFSF